MDKLSPTKRKVVHKREFIFVMSSSALDFIVSYAAVQFVVCRSKSGRPRSQRSGI